MKPIEIFRAGTHISSDGSKHTITTADLAACAKAYDRNIQEAPFVIGHPKENGPAWGWAEKIELQGDVLIAHPAQVEPTFAQMVEAGRFKKRSASFYPPDHPQNPVKGVYYLRHTGFLGAVAPAVPGLKDVQFAAGDGYVEFADWQSLGVVRLLGNLRDWMIGQHGQDTADKVLPADQLDSMAFQAAQPEPKPDASIAPDFSQPGDTVSTPTEIAAREAKLAQDIADFAQQKTAARKTHVIAFVDGLIAAGKLPTGDKDPLVAFMMTIPAEGETATFEFSQAGKTEKVDATEWFQGLLKRLPKIVPTGEAAPHDRAADFSQGRDDVIDPGEIYRVHNRTQK